MLTPSKAIRVCITIVITVILLCFIIPILLLTKVILVEPNAEFAQQLLFIAIPVTLITLLFQLIYFKRGYKRVRQISDAKLKRQKLINLFTIRLGIGLVAVIPNFIFLSLTNFDLFLVINIVLILWMINIFPFPNKVNQLMGKY